MSRSSTFEMNNIYTFRDSGFFNEGEGGDVILRFFNNVIKLILRKKPCQTQIIIPSIISVCVFKHIWRGSLRCNLRRDGATDQRGDFSVCADVTLKLTFSWCDRLLDSLTRCPCCSTNLHQDKDTNSSIVKQELTNLIM